MCPSRSAANAISGYCTTMSVNFIRPCYIPNSLIGIASMTIGHLAHTHAPYSVDHRLNGLTAAFGRGEGA